MMLTTHIENPITRLNHKTIKKTAILSYKYKFFKLIFIFMADNVECH